MKGGALPSGGHRHEDDRKGLSPRAKLTAAAAVALGGGWIAARSAAVPEFWAYVLPAILGGIPIFRAALMAVKRRTLTVDVLVFLAVTTALVTGESLAAAEVVVLMGLGHVLEDGTLDRTRRAVRGLLDLAPQTARRRRGNREEEVPRDALRPGDLVIVRPGQRIPVDGVVVEGLAGVDEAPITGEARVRTKGAGDLVFAGSVAQNGALVFRADRVGPDTTLARMAGMVEEARLRKAPVARQVDRFAAMFIPAVLAVATGVLLVTGDPGRAVTILIGACPCALVLSTPVAVYAAIGSASRRGMLVKGGIFLERLGRARAIALDKTGTLTQGDLEVAEVSADDPEKLLSLAAGLEWLSEHHAGRAVVRSAVDRGLAPGEVTEFEVVPGGGARGKVDGHDVSVGTRKWLASSGVEIPLEVLAASRRAETRGHSAVIVAVDGVARGFIGLADRLRSGAGAAVEGLKGLGLRVVLLSGDTSQAAARVARALGIREHYGGLLPEDKVRAVDRLAAAEVTAMVGDGINDAPALAAASVGIAIGGAGSDLAIEAADVVLVADDLTRLPELVRIGRLALRNIKTNLALSGLSIAGLMAAAAFGLVGPATGALVHEGSALLVILNAMRLLRPPPQERLAGRAEVGAHEPGPAAVAAGGR